MLKPFKLFFLTIVMMVLVSCGAAPTQESTGQYIDSAAITAKVKTNLIDQLGAKGFAIKVKTYKDEVQLSGFVDSAVTKRHAGMIAANTIDVRRVRNSLIVKSQ